jgi:hypothetical protein
VYPAGLVIAAAIHKVNEQKKKEFLKAVLLYARNMSQHLKAGIEC